MSMPYTIELSGRGKPIFTYEPMNSPAVRARFAFMDQFYSESETLPFHSEENRNRDSFGR